MVPYVTGSIVCFILSEYYNPLFGLIPPIAMLCTGIMLRLHVARLYNIKAGGPCVECMIGCCCCFCSLAQSKRIATRCRALLATSKYFSPILICQFSYQYLSCFCVSDLYSIAVGVNITSRSQHSLSTRSYLFLTQQVSRHIAGYKKVFDGDADIIMKEYHDRP